MRVDCKIVGVRNNATVRSSRAIYIGVPIQGPAQMRAIASGRNVYADCLLIFIQIIRMTVQRDEVSHEGENR